MYNIIPIFTDNYIFTLQGSSSSPCFVLVDPGESSTLVETLGLTTGSDVKLKILITHHHPDHIGGLKELTKNFSCEVWGPEQDSKKIPEIQHGLEGGETLNLGPFTFQVLHLPGHTLDHLVYYEVRQQWLFCGDVLFRYGCGRLFEGDYSMAFESLQKVKALPDSTLIFCSHEYTEQNLEFACAWAQTQRQPEWFTRLQEEKITIARLRQKNLPTVPFLLGEDKKLNPFLRAQNVEEFKEARLARNQFSKLI